MDSCSTLPALAISASQFCHEGLFNSSAGPMAVGDLPDVFVREFQAASNRSDGTSRPGNSGKLRLKRYRIHESGNQPKESDSALHLNRVSSSSKKHTIRVTEDARAAVGEAFLKARKELRLSQAQIGRQFNKSQNAVYTWEAGSAAPPIEVIRWLGRQASPSARHALFVAAGIEDNTEGLLALVSEVRSIPLVNPNQLRDPEAKVERSIALPADWLPENANIKAARFSSRLSNLFGDELIALIDTGYPDPEKLVGCIVVTPAPKGNEPRILRKLGRTFYLESLRGDPPQQLRREGDWSIVGTVLKWLADAPSPKKVTKI